LVDADIVLELAVSTNMINTSNGINLPNNYASINAFMQTPFAMQKQLSIWREDNSAEYYSVFSNFFNNEELTSSPDTLEQVGNVFLKSADYLPHFEANELMLDPDKTGYYHKSGAAKGDMVWSLDNEQLTLTFNETFELIRFNDVYCGSNIDNRITFATDTLSLKVLYSTVSYVVYIRKHSGQLENSNCFNADSHQIEYDTVIKHIQKPLDITAGIYHFASASSYFGEGQNFGEGQHGDAYHNVSSTFNLTENGDFIETIDTILAPRTGIWKLTNGQLQLDYGDGMSVFYEKNAQYLSLNMASYRAVVDNETVYVGETFVVPKQMINWKNTTGNMLYSGLSNFNVELYSGFGFQFNTDFTGVHQTRSDGVWQDSGSSSTLYTWSLIANRYKLDYYFDTETYTYLNFCDVSGPNCEIWRHREVEIIGQVNEHYIVKVYQELDYSILGVTAPSFFRGGNIYLVNFSAL
jgi:hypothetical protein